jgi:HSP20 family molecular chaperone IbpA
MATLDFTPLVRSSIGFDQLPGLLAHALERPETTYPPYNIEKVGENQYRIVMAVAGFAGMTWKVALAGGLAHPSGHGGLRHPAWT